jgi:acyl-CoA hydrolase
MCVEIPLCYHQGPGTIRNYCDFNVAFITTGEMDKSGYFNYGLSNSLTGAALSKSKCIILEVNKSVPYCYGGRGESIHISGVDYIVEGNDTPLAEVKSPPPAKEDRRIAEHIVKEIEDGACLCLGIDGVSNLIGQLIAASDLKDLGIHAEMLGDSCVDLYNAGKITGRNKSVDPFKMVYTYALGSKKLYDFLDRHPACASYPANYTNNPAIIAQNDKVVAIHPAVEVDLYGQVCSETLSEDRQSGTAGQLDFTFGAFMSKGGKGIMTLRSAYRDHEGIRRSRIVPKLASGSIVTVPGSIVQYVATEYGIAELNGKSIRERADALIGIAHPEFREELIRQAGKIKI